MFLLARVYFHDWKSDMRTTKVEAYNERIIANVVLLEKWWFPVVFSWKKSLICRNLSRKIYFVILKRSFINWLYNNLMYFLYFRQMTVIILSSTPTYLIIDWLTDRHMTIIYLLERVVFFFLIFVCLGWLCLIRNSK